jgi:hypothetical protein
MRWASPIAHEALIEKLILVLDGRAAARRAQVARQRAPEIKDTGRARQRVHAKLPCRRQYRRRWRLMRHRHAAAIASLIAAARAAIIVIVDRKLASRHIVVNVTSIIVIQIVKTFHIGWLLLCFFFSLSLLLLLLLLLRFLSANIFKTSLLLFIVVFIVAALVLLVQDKHFFLFNVPALKRKQLKERANIFALEWPSSLNLFKCLLN